MFSSPEELAEKLRSVQYVIANELLPVIYLALKLGGPLLYSRGAARFRKNRVCLCRSESCWNGDRKAAVLRRDTEQRGPHPVLGGHTLMARTIAPMIARKLANALVAPVLPFSVGPAGGVDAKWPGSVALAPDLFQRVNEAVVDSMVKNASKISYSWVITAGAKPN